MWWMDTARLDKQPFPKAGRLSNWCTTAKNLAAVPLGQTGPKPPTQLLPEAQKAKMVPMVSVDYKWHMVNADAQSPILPASNKIA